MDHLFYHDNHSETSGPGDYIFNFDQPSPTPRVSQSSGHSTMFDRMSVSQSGESLNDYPRQTPPCSRHIFTYNCGPREGWTGTQICIKVDVDIEALMGLGHLVDRLVLVLGGTVLETNNRLLTGGQPRIRNAQIRILTAVIPENGRGLDYEPEQQSALTIQLLDGRGETAETVHMGPFDFNPNQAMLGAPGVPKREREADLVEVDRNQGGPSQPRWAEHRRPSGPMIHPPPIPPNMVGNMSLAPHPFDGQTMYIAAPTPNMSMSFLSYVSSTSC